MGMASETNTTATHLSKVMKSENNQSLSSEISDYTKVYIEGAGQELRLGNVPESCNQCYIKRQASENGDIERKHFLQQDLNMASNSHKADSGEGACVIQMQSGSSNTELNTSKNDVKHSVNAEVRDQASKRPGLMNVSVIERQQSLVYPSLTRQLSTTSVASYKKTWQCCSLAKVSCLLSLGAVVFSAMVLFYMVFNNDFQLWPVEATPEVVNTDTPITAALQGNLGNQTRVAGRFVMVSPYFDTNGMVWESMDPTNNMITVYGECLVVPEEGTYAVFSLITFRVFQEDSVSTLGHYIRLHNAFENEKTFQRQIASVPTDRGNPEYIPSSFVSFVGLQAGGKICIDVSLTKFVYRSTLDNSINIFKL